MSWFFFLPLLLMVALPVFWLSWLPFVTLHRFELCESSSSCSTASTVLSPDPSSSDPIGEYDMAYESSPIDSKLFTEELVGRIFDVHIRAPVLDLLLRARPGTDTSL
jgi:hypothetical protein